MCLVQPLPSGQHRMQAGGWWEPPSVAHEQGLPLQWQQLWGTQNEPAALPRAANCWPCLAGCPRGLAGCDPAWMLWRGRTGWQNKGFQESWVSSPGLHSGETAHGASVSWGDPVTQSWQPNPACLHTASLLLPALEITPSLCCPGQRWHWCTPGLTAGSLSAGPSLGKQVPSPGLQRRGQPSWQGAPGASARARVPPACLDGTGECSPHASSPTQTGRSHAACARQPLSQLARPPPGMGDTVPALGPCPWWCLSQRLEDALLALSPHWRGWWLRRGCGAFGHLPRERTCGRRSWLQAAVPGQPGCPGLSLPGHGQWHRTGGHSVTPPARVAAQSWGAQHHHHGGGVCVRVHRCV